MPDGLMPMEEQADKLRALAIRLYTTLCDLGHDPGLEMEDLACLIGADIETAANYAQSAGLDVPEEYTKQEPL